MPDYLTTHHPTAAGKWANYAWKPGTSLLDDDDEGPNLIHLDRAMREPSTPLPATAPAPGPAAPAPELKAYDTLEEAVQAALTSSPGETGGASDGSGAGGGDDGGPGVAGDTGEGGDF